MNPQGRGEMERRRHRPGMVRSFAVVVLLATGAASARAAHPRLYFGAEDLPGLRARAADTTDTGLGWTFASVFDEMRTAADGYRAARYSVTMEIPNPNGVGSVTWSYALSTSQPPPHPSNPSFPAWTRVSRELQGRMEALAFVYAVTGDAGYLTNANRTGALDVALDIAAWSQWTDPETNCGDSCLDTAHLTLGVSFVYDVGFNPMPAGSRSALRTAIVEKGVRKLRNDVNGANPFAWFNGYALRATGLAVGAASVADEVGAEANPWLTLAHDAIDRFFDEQGADGGAWEGHQYGSYAVDDLVVGVHALGRRGLGEDLFVHPWLLGLPHFAAAFLGTNGRSLAPFGDSSADVFWSGTMFALAARGEATAQWYLVESRTSRPNSVMRFLWANPALVPVPMAGSGSAFFPDVGYAALRAGFAGDPVVAVKSGPASVAIEHNHLDHNSVVVNAHGEWIASDPGYRSYFNAAERLYTAGTVGHNTVMVDKSVSANGTTATGGQDELAGGTLSYFFDGEGYAKVVANAASAYPSGLLSRFGRRVFYAKPDLVWVFDDLAAASAHAYSFLLHTVAAGTFSAGDGPAEMVARGRAARLQAFLVSSAPWASGYPRATSHPGAAGYGPYAEWRTQAATGARLAAALVPGPFTHATLYNPGFENGLASWTPRMTDATHTADPTVAHGGAQSGRISFGGTNTGYYYSEPLAVAAGGQVSASVWARAAAEATGTLSINFVFMKDGSHLQSGGFTSIAAANATAWTRIDTPSLLPPAGADAVRVKLMFVGGGTVWFDDATFTAAGLPPDPPPAQAVALGTPPAGLAVAGDFGVDAGASLMGSGLTGAQTLAAASAGIPMVPSLSSNGQIFTIGLDPQGALRRAFLQGGTFLSVGNVEMVRATTTASFDLAVLRNDDGCPRLVMTEVPTVEGPPYTVRASPREVWLGTTRVAFAVQGDRVTFPMGSDIGPGCPDAGDIIFRDGF